MSLTASEERKVIAQLFNDEKMQIALDKILSGKRLEDKAYEQLVSKAFVERAKIGFGGATLFTLSDSDMQMRASALMGVNDLGKSIVDDGEFVKSNLPDFLRLAKDGSENSPLMNAELCRAMVRYINNPEDMKMPDPAREAFESVLTNDFKKSLTKRMMDGAFTSPLSEVDSEKLYVELGLRSVSVDPEDIRVKTEELNKETTAPTPSSEKEPNPGESAPEANAMLSTDAMLRQVGIMAEKADLEARKHRLQVDAQTEAQMAINKLMDENPNWVRRTSIHKLKDKLSNGASSLLGQDPHVYPSESLFGDSLAVMDAHGRVEQTLLHYRSGPGLDKRVEFRSPSVPEEAYKLAALQVKQQGIAQPHISSNFRDPKTSLEFMTKSVEALIDAGYKIEDISVDRHLQNAFENFKLDKVGEVYSIGERPATEPVPEPELTREVMPEEIIEAKNEAINTPALHVADMLADIEKGLGFNDIPNERLEPIMPFLAELANPEKTWQQIQDESGLTPAGRDVVEKLKHHLDSAVSKLDPESERFSKNGPPAKDVKLIASSLNLLEPIYGKETLNRIMPSLQEKADIIVKREAEKAEKMARAEAKPKGSEPEHLENQSNNVSAQAQNIESVPTGQDPSGGFDPDLNGENVPSHMNEAPPFDDSAVNVDPGYEGFEHAEYDEQGVYIPPELEKNRTNVDDMVAQPQNVDDMAAQAQNFDDMPAQPQNVDDMAAQAQNFDDMPAQPQNVEDMAAQAQNFDDMPAQPQNVEDMAAQAQNFDDMPAQPQNVDDMAAQAQNFDDMPAQPQYYTGDEVSMSKQELDEVTASLEQAIEQHEAGYAENNIDKPNAGDSEPKLEGNSEKTLQNSETHLGVPEAWMKKLEEIGWEDLTPEQVRKIPKPSDFSDDQKKTVAYSISNTVNALLNMDEFLIDTATPKEKAFIERMPPDMLPPKLEKPTETAPEVEPKQESEPEVQNDFTRRRR